MDLMLSWPQSFAVAAAIMIFDAMLGDPPWLWRRLPHPIVVYGRILACADRWFNRSCDPDWLRRGAGCVVMMMAIGGAAILGLAVVAVCLWIDPGGLMAVAVTIIIATAHLAGRDLHDRCADLAAALAHGDENAARGLVHHLVGRDVDSLDASGIGRAAIESLAENTCDAVVSAIFWFVIAGLPGLMAYKMISTADSMLGYRTPRHRSFGWAAARLDDLANWLPARLTALLFMIMAAIPLPGGRFNHQVGSWRRICRDAPGHASVNAGYPETAMGLALGVRLAGPRCYQGQWVDDPWMVPEGRQHVGYQDIEKGLRLYRRSLIFLLLLLICLALGGGITAMRSAG